MSLKESLRKRFENSLRVASVASITLAPYTPNFSPQKELQGAKDNGHTLKVDTPLNLNGVPKTLEAPDGRGVVFGNTEREQVQSQEVSVFGVMAGFNARGNLIISAIDGETREIVLPRVSGFVFGEAKFSPDGARIAIWRQHRDGPPPVKHDTYLVASGTGEIAPFIPEFLENLGQFPTYRSFTWSPDGKKLAFAAGQHGGGKTIGVDLETGQVLFELRGSGFGEFSPDGQWFAKIDIEGKNLEVVNMSGPRLILPNNAEFFSWSPDSRYITFHRCLMWSEGGQGPHCNVSKLSVFDLERQESKDFEYSMSYVRPVFSPDGRKIAFREFNNTRIAMLSILDVNTGRRASVNFPSEEIPLNNDWSLRFYDNERLLAWGRKFRDSRTHLIWVDSKDASVVNQQWLSQRGYSRVLLKGIVEGRIICGIQDNRDRTGWGIAQITDRDGELSVTPLFYFSGGSPVGTSEIFGLAREGDLVKSATEDFVFAGGVLHRIEHKEIAGYFGGQVSSMPEGLASFIPEGEKISFRPGDVVGDKDLGIWYLRNGKRYKIQNWDWFLRGQRLPQETKPISADKAILEIIPVGEPTLVQKEGELGWLDWDGNFVEFQPYGGRMIIFVGGYGGSTSGQIEAFEQIKAKLAEKGWRRTQFLEATYNIDIEALHRGEIKPKEYKSEDTKANPMLSASKLRLELRRYKEMLPLTNFIIVGHSLGGLEALEATLAHTDAVKMVITLDSPLKGVDRAFWSEHADKVVEFMGHEVGEYLVLIGDNPEAREKQEQKGLKLRAAGVKLFTFANEQDWFVRSDVAVLRGASQDFEGNPVRLRWDLWHAPADSLFGDLVAGHGQVLIDQEFIEYIAGILPPS